MLISNKHKFAFVHIPKTGGTSIKAALLPYANPNQLKIVGEKVTDLGNYKPHIPLRPGMHKDKFKFAVVRNSWEWYVSHWKFLHKRNLKPVCDLTFEEYINTVETLPSFLDKNQHWWIAQNGKMLTDYTIRFETLEEQFAEVCQKLGIPEISLGHYKNAGGYDYRDFYTDKLRDKVASHCAKDIAMFGWKF